MYGYTRDKEGNITGEIDRLRYSAFDCWNKSKESYRKRYYEGESFQTMETVFGHQSHRALEKGEVVLEGIPKYLIKEYNIELTLPGTDIKIGGCLDCFDPVNFAFLDYKFSHRNKDGKAPWDAVKVARHAQMVFYSLLIKLKHGKVAPKTHLVWVETVLGSKTVEYAGHTLVSEGRELSLTGHFEPFERRIYKWELDLLVEKIKKVAREIEEDFIKYKEQHA